MKSIVFSDIHFHNWQTNSHVKGNGLNSRLVHTADRMKDIIRLADEKNADCILFAGDFFHVKKIDAEVIDVAVRSLQSCTRPIIGTVGNHDMGSYIEQTHSARAVSGKINFLDNFNGNKHILSNGDIIYGLPYHTNLDAIKTSLKKVPENTKILLMHQGIKGAWLGEGFEGDTEDSIDPALVYERADLVIVGHFHTPQLIIRGHTYKVNSGGKMDAGYTPGFTVLVPGAVEQHNFGDKGQERGCWFIDTDTKEVEFFPLSSPKFLEVDAKSDPQTWHGNYVRFIGNAKDVPKTDDIIAESFTVEAEKPKMEASCHNYHLNPSDPLKKVLTTYIQNSPMAGLDNDRLFKKGMELIS